MKAFIPPLATCILITTVTSAIAADSTAIRLVDSKPAVQTYLLEDGSIQTKTGNTTVKFIATQQRCQEPTTPTLITSLNGIEWYGLSQAIEGVVNTLTLNTSTYVISGHVQAPVNIKGARANGVSVNWQIWCKANATA